MARRGDWVPCRDWGDIETAIAGVATEYVLLRHGDNILQVPAISAMEETDDIVCERVVGQYELLSTGEDPVTVICRIRVGIYDDLNDTAAFYADDFNDANQANEPFLWQRIMVATEISSIDAIVSPAWSMVDCRVKRKLSREQALFFSVFPVNADVQVRAWLRTWARM